MILVTGATGNVGREVTGQDGEPASAEVSRYLTSSTRSANFQPSGVRW